MSSLRAFSPLRRLAAFLALLGWVGLGASVCLCAHAAPNAAPVAAEEVQFTPSCHGAQPEPGNTRVGATFSSTCCREGQPAPLSLVLDGRGPRNDLPKGAKAPLLGAPWLRGSIEPTSLRGAVAAPLEVSPPHSPPPAFVLPLRI